MSSDELESQVNEILLQNGWDYDARKRVTFMLRNKSDAQAERSCSYCAMGRKPYERAGYWWHEGGVTCA